MSSLMQHFERRLILTGLCLFVVLMMTGCSVFESSSHLMEAQEGVSPYALASADDAFAAEPFSLVAADSVGLATFGFEIAMWADMAPADALAQQN